MNNNIPMIPNPNMMPYLGNMDYQVSPMPNYYDNNIDNNLIKRIDNLEKRVKALENKINNNTNIVDYQSSLHMI